MERQRRNTLILALALLAVLAAAFGVQRWLARGGGATAVIKVEGQVVHTLPLFQDCELWIGDGDTGRNLVRVEDGKVMVAQADCPDKVCVHTGAIRREGEVIACLPHNLIVYIPFKGE